MKIKYYEEPLLEFRNNGKEICPKLGITKHGVNDTYSNVNYRSLKMGVIVFQNNYELINQWLDNCHKPVDRPDDKIQKNLFMPFPGFNRNHPFYTEIVCNDSHIKEIKISILKDILEIKDQNTKIEKAIETYYEEIKYFKENKPDMDVILCVMPKTLFKALRDNPKKLTNDKRIDFRRKLKADCMKFGIPLQLISEDTILGSKNRQDNATIAWNLFTALYYKAGGLPWKLCFDRHNEDTCYVGVGFYRDLDNNVLHTSMAQLFNERGQSIILRGEGVSEDKRDKRPHLTGDQAYNLITNALNEYKKVIKRTPDRIVIHKTSKYYDDELEGLNQASKNFDIYAKDFININKSKIRLFRNGNYPVMRGTNFSISEDRHILYTRGTVPFYQTYTGMYVPDPLDIRLTQYDSSPNQILSEILALSKMNWNNTQLDGKPPITITCSYKVSEIMKYIDDDQHINPKYCFYM